jgi:membrane associated rhomboid family serine protease
LNSNTPLEYRQFLDRATSGLTVAGGQLLLAEGTSSLNAPWTAGWDRIVLSESPGANAIYAFTDASDGTEAVRRRIDTLATGVAQTGWLRNGGLGLVAVAVFPRGLAGTRAATVTRLSPSTFYQGLKPATWVVDLAEPRVYTGKRWKTEPGEILLQAASPGGAMDVLDADGTQVLARVNRERTEAFYSLMRGRQPYATYALMAINIVVYLLLYLHGGPDNEGTLRDYGGMSARLIEQGQWWRLFSSMFLHASVTHILFNMTSLFAVGTLAERLYGSYKYLAIYIGSGLVGSLASFAYSVWTNQLDVLGVGASGAIFGVAGALLTLRFQSSEVIPRSLRARISGWLIPLVGLNLVFSFVTPYVDSRAHIGGLLAGMALSFLFPVEKRVPVTS